MSTKRWPVTNADELTRHVARQFPELKRRQVMTVLNAALLAVRDSLLAQAEAGMARPHVTISNFGVFELRRYKAVRRPHLAGGFRIIPERWRVAFRPSARWAQRMAEISTRTTTQEPPGRNLDQESASCSPPDEEAPRHLPDLPAGSS